MTTAPNGFGGGFTPPAAFQRPAGNDRPPPIPTDLLASVRIWKKGKGYNRDGTPRTLPWVAVEVTDCDHQIIVHQDDDLGEATDPETLAGAIWTRINQSVRSRNDGIPHHFLATCIFADTEGRQTKSSWEGSHMLPVENQTWGSGPGAAMSRFGGSTFLARRDFQEASRERDRIELMGVAMTIMQQSQFAMMQSHSEDRGELRDMRRERVEVFNLWRSMVEDKRAQDREDRWEDRKMAMLEMAVGRLSHLAAPLGLSVTKWLGNKLGMIQPKTPREAKSFHTLRRLVECAQGKIKEKIAEAAKAMGLSPEEAAIQSQQAADNPDALMSALADMGVPEDDPVIDDLMDLLVEMRMEMSNEKAARLSAREILKPQVVEAPAPTPEKEDP